MRALGLVILISAQGLAGWQPLGSVGGTTQDVVVTDGGGVVATSTGAMGTAVWFASDGTVVAQMSGDFVGAGAFEPNCLVGLQLASKTVAFSSALCGANALLPGGATPARFRLTGGGGARLVRTNVSFDGVYSAVSPAGSWGGSSNGSITWLGRTPRALGIARVGADDFTVFNPQVSSIYWMLNDGSPQSTAVGYASFDLVPFPLDGAPAVLSSQPTGGLAIVRDVRDAGSGFDAVSIPAGLSALNTAFTNEGGRGYGVVTTATGAVLSPIPDPSRPGQTWVTRNAAPVLSGRVHCNGSTWCAGYTAAGVVYLLTNAAQPTVDVTPITLRPGTAQQLVADAGDADGDPVFVSWSTAGVSLTQSNAAGTVVAVSSTATACAFATVPVTITAWDGMAGHETSVTIQLPVEQGTVSVSPASLTVAAGSSAQTFTASIDGGCPLSVTGWSTGSAGPTTTWTPPRNVCVASGTTFPITVNANGQVVSSNVLVQPWGPSEAPVFPTGATQDAGTSVVWVPTNQLHACVGSAGFPGVGLSWEVDAGSTGAVARPVDGGLLVSAASGACLAATFSASARSSFSGLSAPGVLVVSMAPDIAPLGPTTPFTMQLASPPGVATSTGTFSVIAPCLNQRTLGTNVRLLSADAGLISSSGQGAATWSVAVPPACDPRHLVVAELVEGATRTGAQAQVAVVGRSSAQPIVATTPFSTGAGTDGGVIGGWLDVQANCLAERSLYATISIFQPDGGPRADGGFAAPGSWALPVTPTCDARLWVLGTLYEDGGPTGVTELVSLMGPTTQLPITPTTQFTMNLTHDAGVARGNLDLASNCLAERGATAAIIIRQLDGGVVADGGFAVPGPWALNVPAACDPRFLARADLFERGSPTSRFEEVAFTGTSSASPLNASTPFSMNLSFEAAAARATGRLEVTADCVAARALTATITISRAGGAAVTSGTFAVPGDWALEVPGGCSGGDFTVRAELLSFGQPAGPVDTGAFSATRLPLNAGPLSPSTLEVTCGVGARATVTLDALPGSCTAGALTWRQVAGPEVELARQQGRALDVQSRTTDFSLVGQVVQLEIAVDAGIGSQAVFQRDLQLTAPPFVTVEPRLRPVLPTSEEPVAAEIVITNTSACAVDALDVAISLRNLAPQEGSVMVDDVAVAATFAQDGLVTAPIALAGNQRAILRFRAKPLLVGAPTMTALASVRGVPVTMLTSRKETGCGCEAGGGALAWLCFATLFRRRRAR